MPYQHKLITKAIKHYKYNEPPDAEKTAEEFFHGYQFSYKNYKKNKYNFEKFCSILIGLPEGTHSAAKKLLWQGNAECWKYFERTALFWTITALDDEWLDHLKDAFLYALYVERDDLLGLLIQKTQSTLQHDTHKHNKEFLRQAVYPSTYLAHFLTGKWLGHNPVLEQVLQFGKGYGIYQPLIDHWDDYSALENDYWNELCEYHLGQLSLFKPDKRNYEEFIGVGLVPVELINLFKVRRRLGLDVPVIGHELFQTPMAAQPVIPTGYDERFDLFYQMAKRTSETRLQYTAEEVVAYIRETYGAGDNDILVT